MEHGWLAEAVPQTPELAFLGSSCRGSSGGDATSDRSWRARLKRSWT